MLSNLIPSALFTAAALACGSHPIRSTDPGNQTNPLTLGSDTPSDRETSGYFINHISLSVQNLTRSIDFYSHVFGMRHMFTYQTTPHISFSYVGHSQGGRNGSGYQTAEEMYRNRYNMAGLIELMYLDVEKAGLPSGPQPTQTLNHLGFVVPDVVATQRRLEEYGVTIHKRVDEPVSETGYLANKDWLGQAENLDDGEYEVLKEAIGAVNRLVVYATDPDGNLIEIQPLE